MPLPTDPLLSLQWYLINSTPGGLDLNVEGVWNPASGPDYTGQGVTVAVVSNGFEYSHPDLAGGSYSTTLDFDFLGNDVDPINTASDLDGTALIGLVGANDNGLNTVGVAYDATLIGYRTLAVPAVGLAASWVSHFNGAMTAAATNADVVSFGAVLSSTSIGYFTNYLDSTQLASLRSTLDAAVDTGRGGLGLIAVVGSGATGASAGSSDANAYGVTNDTRQIVVGSLEQDGYATLTSNQGASLLVSAFAENLATLDLTGAAGFVAGDTFASYGSNEAAAALVSGVVSLVLDANAQLGWRDVQTILAYGARHVGTEVGQGFNSAAGFHENSAWFFNGATNWNAGGLHFSNDYGFGLVDAFASVRLAETWFLGVGATVAQTSANETAISVDLLAAPVGLDNATSTLTTTVTQDIVVERVAVTVDFQTSYIGDVDILLIAPDGTQLTLLADQAGGFDFNGVWTVEGQALRGISSAGEWRVLVIDDTSVDPTTLRDVQLTIYGSAQVNDRYIFTDEYSDYGAYNRINTVVDTDGGIDVVNAAAVSGNSTIFLDGTVSLIDTMRTTFSGVENAIGGDGNDSITGNTGANEIWGGRGRDTMRGGDGEDGLYGDTGNDLVYGENGNDTVNGGDGDDTLYGGSGNDTLAGGSGTDFMYGSFENDLFLMGSGNDYADGGSGTNTASYAAETSGVLVDLSGTLTHVGGALGDTLVSIQNLIGSEQSDTLHGNTGVNVLQGGGGIDQLFGGDGNDSLYGGDGNDSLYGGIGADLLDGGDGTRDLASYNSATVAVFASLTNPALNTFSASGDVFVGIEGLVGSDHADTLTGDTGANWLYGGLGLDSLLGQAGDDSLFGLGGNDTLIGGAGADSLDGGTGTMDFASYADASTGVAAFLNSPIANTGDALGDTYAAIEGLEGSAFDDILGGNSGENEIRGLNGNDEIFGGLGNDTVYGGNGDDIIGGDGGNDVVYGDIGNDRFLLIPGDGNDSVYGGSGNDLIDYSAYSIGAFVDMLGIIAVNLDIYDSVEGIVGTGFNDTLLSALGDESLYGGNGNDILIGRLGADTFYGGDGNDIVTYELASAAVQVNMLLPAAGTGEAAGDAFDSIEQIYGTSFNDTMTGGNGNETVIGGLGDDLLYGGGGNDSLTGDGGSDNLWGGAGADVHSGGSDIVVDYARYDDANHGNLVISLATPASNTGAAAGDTYFGIEGLVGGAGNDTITGTAFGNFLFGSGGADMVYGGDGNDYLSGDAGADNLWGGTGADQHIGGSGAEVDYARYDDANHGNLVISLLTPASNTGAAAGDTYNGIEGLVGGAGNDTITGDGLANFLFGSGGADQVYGGAGNDYLSGDAGADNLWGGTGADQHIGGSGAEVDYARYDDANHGNLVISLLTPASNTGAAAGDTYNGIEGLVGGLGNDTITGDGLANFLFGGGGGDQLYGGTGNDYLSGDAGGDNLWGGTGADQHIGGSGVEVDYARYDDANHGNLTISLLAPASNTGAAAGDTYNGIEGLVGGAGNDVIVGDALANWLFGSGGNDFIDGREGNDYLNGGAGDDDFRFATALGATNIDTVADFVAGSDDILLAQSIFTAIGATLTADEFVIGTAALDANDFVIYNSATGTLTYDSNGNVAGGATQFATLSAALALTVGDFVMV